MPVQRVATGAQIKSKRNPKNPKMPIHRIDLEVEVRRHRYELKSFMPLNAREL